MGPFHSIFLKAGNGIYLMVNNGVVLANLKIKDHSILTRWLWS